MDVVIGGAGHGRNVKAYVVSNAMCQVKLTSAAAVGASDDGRREASHFGTNDTGGSFLLTFSNPSAG